MKIFRVLLVILATPVLLMVYLGVILWDLIDPQEEERVFEPMAASQGVLGAPDAHGPFDLKLTTASGSRRGRQQFRTLVPSNNPPIVNVPE
jgi:hypothetical protein